MAAEILFTLEDVGEPCIGLGSADVDVLFDPISYGRRPHPTDHFIDEVKPSLIIGTPSSFDCSFDG